MDFDLSPEHLLIRDTVRDFARKEIAPVAEQLDHSKSFPYEIVRGLAALNLKGIPFPAAYGGGGARDIQVGRREPSSAPFCRYAGPTRRPGGLGRRP